MPTRTICLVTSLRDELRRLSQEHECGAPCRHAGREEGTAEVHVLSYAQALGVDGWRGLSLRRLQDRAGRLEHEANAGAAKSGGGRGT